MFQPLHFKDGLLKLTHILLMWPPPHLELYLRNILLLGRKVSFLDITERINTAYALVFKTGVWWSNPSCPASRSYNEQCKQWMQLIGRCYLWHNLKAVSLKAGNPWVSCAFGNVLILHGKLLCWRGTGWILRRQLISKCAACPVCPVCGSVHVYLRVS